MDTSTLLSLLSSGKVSGPGTGVSDSIPAKGPGNQAIALSDGEYVVRADVVAALGGGSSDAGARFFDQFSDKVLKMNRDQAIMLAEVILESAEQLKSLK